MIRFSSKTRESVGLDIGTHSIKVVAMDHGDHEPTITSYNIKNIPENSKKQDLKTLVKEALKEVDLSPEEVTLGFSGAGVIVRFIDLPRMTKDQLSGALDFEAEKYIPFSVNDVVMDFLILGDSAEKGKMRVLLAAAKKELVQSRMDLVRELDMSINVLDIDSLAVFNAFEASKKTEDKSLAFFHFGHTQANVAVAVDKTPSFIRQIQIGGRDVIEALNKDGLDGGKDGDFPAMGEKAMEERSLSTTHAILDDITREMQLSFGYFENRYNTKVREVLCSGGMSYQRNILSYLSAKTGLEMKVWNPIGGLALAEHLSREDMDKVGPLLTVSVGLALRT